MKITFATIAQGGILSATLVDENDSRELRLKNTDFKTIELDPGSYDFEWHVSQNGKASYTFSIQSEDLKVDIQFTKSYISRKEDGSYFKINI